MERTLTYPHLSPEANIKILNKKFRKIQRRIKRNRPTEPNGRYFKRLGKGSHVVYRSKEQEEEKRVRNTNNTQFNAIPLSVYREEYRKYLEKTGSKISFMDFLMKFFKDVLERVGLN